MIKGRQVGLRRTLVTLFHKKLRTVTEGLWATVRKRKKSKNGKQVRGNKSRNVRHGSIYHKSVC